MAHPAEGSELLSPVPSWGRIPPLFRQNSTVKGVAPQVIEAVRRNNEIRSYQYENSCNRLSSWRPSHTSRPLRLTSRILCLSLRPKVRQTKLKGFLSEYSSHPRSMFVYLRSNISFETEDPRTQVVSRQFFASRPTYICRHWSDLFCPRDRICHLVSRECPLTKRGTRVSLTPISPGHSPSGTRRAAHFTEGKYT